MSSSRRKLPKITSTKEPDHGGIFGELTQSPREIAEAEAKEAAKAQPPPPVAPAPTVAPAEMTMAEIQEVPKSGRRPTNFALPNALDLHRRMTYYKIDHGVQIQDQFAFSADQWLREQGY